MIKQIQKFENGIVLRYDEINMEDKFGSLSDQPLDNDECIDDEIQKTEFYNNWGN